MSSTTRDLLVTRWNALDRRDRVRIRRLVRLGRPVETGSEASLAVSYADFQLSRPWMRFFWLWFAPGAVVALGIATQIHPLLIGIVIALAAQAVFARRNLRRVRHTNQTLLQDA